MIRPPLSTTVAALPPSVPFVAPEAIERRTGSPLALRLGANESAFGISPGAQQAMRAAIAQTSWYADPENYDLRAGLAAHHRIDIDHIVVGSGIDGLLGLIVRAFVEPGTHVVTSLGTYPTFNYHAIGYGGTLQRVPYAADDRQDLERLSQNARALGARLVYLANPDNPSGTCHRAVDIDALLNSLPPDCMLALDEAYGEFASAEEVPTIRTDDPRLVRFRTFSKAHGMAGARIAYVIAHTDVTDAVNKIRNQFEVNRVAQAGALASLGDQTFITSVIDAVAAGRREYMALADRLGLPTIASSANFVCIDIGGADRARDILARLQRHGVFVRMPGEAPLSRCIRVTVGTAPQRAQFAEVFEGIVKGSS